MRCSQTRQIYRILIDRLGNITGGILFVVRILLRISVDIDHDMYMAKFCNLLLGIMTDVSG